MFQRFTLAIGARFTLILQWDEPFSVSGPPGAQNDLDIYLFNPAGHGAGFGRNDNLGKDPLEVVSISCSPIREDPVRGLLDVASSTQAPTTGTHEVRGAGWQEAPTMSPPAQRVHHLRTRQRRGGGGGGRGRLPEDAPAFRRRSGRPRDVLQRRPDGGTFDAAGHRLAAPRRADLQAPRSSPPTP